jgi:hypothetical protein
MAHYGPVWPQIPALQGLLQLYYGWIWSAEVYGLWFTRERSKVRSLVRPPFLLLKHEKIRLGLISGTVQQNIENNPMQSSRRLPPWALRIF